MQSVSQHHAPGQGLHVALIHHTVHTGQIHLVHMAFGGEQRVPQRTVISEQEQPLGVLVQPPHRKQAPAAQVLRQKIQHRPLIPVLRGGQQTRRLMEHEIDEGGAVHPLTIHRQFSLRWFPFLLRTEHRTAIDQDPALPDQVLDLLPGPAPGGGQQLIQTFQGHPAQLLSFGRFRSLPGFFAHLLIVPKTPGKFNTFLCRPFSSSVLPLPPGISLSQPT